MSVWWSSLSIIYLSSSEGTFSTNHRHTYGNLPCHSPCRYFPILLWGWVYAKTYYQRQKNTEAKAFNLTFRGRRGRDCLVDIINIMCKKKKTIIWLFQLPGWCWTRGKLSQFLFTFFLNDLEDFFNTQIIFLCNYVTVTCILYTSFFLLYANDAILLAETADELQNIWLYLKSIVKNGNFKWSWKRRKRWSFRNGSQIWNQNSNCLMKISTYVTLVRIQGLFLSSMEFMFLLDSNLLNQAQKALYALYRK
jgi:hypothetical protein